MTARKTLKCICAGILSIIMLAGTAAALNDGMFAKSINSVSVSAEVLTGEDLVYTAKFGKITITGTNVTSGAIEIPSEIDGLPVTKIDTGVFRDLTELTAVIIPGSVTQLSYNVFTDCTGLESVILEEGVEEIGAYSFQGCTSLKSMIMPDSIVTIGNSAFDGCIALSELKLSPNIAQFGNYVFQRCFGLTSVEIPEGIKSISNYAFQFCENLEEVSLPSTLTNIGGRAFKSCSKLGDITIPATVTNIGLYTFEGCGDIVTPFIVYGYKGSAAEQSVLNDTFYDVLIKFVALDEEGTTTPEPNEEIRGDINGDNLLSVADIVTMSSYIVGKPVEIIGNADLNQDGIINIFDCIQLVQLYMDKNN